jgi:hypothetical protein
MAAATRGHFYQCPNGHSYVITEVRGREMRRFNVVLCAPKAYSTTYLHGSQSPATKPSSLSVLFFINERFFLTMSPPSSAEVPCKSLAARSADVPLVDLITILTQAIAERRI